MLLRRESKLAIRIVRSKGWRVLDILDPNLRNIKDVLVSSFVNIS